MKRLPEKLARWQLRSAGKITIGSFLIGSMALPLIIGVPGLVDGLTLNSDFTAMLPDSAQSVRDMHEIQERFGGQQALILTVESDDLDAVQRFTRDLAARIEVMQERKVVAVDWNLSDFEEFVVEHGHLYADLDDLEAIRDALSARLEYERARVEAQSALLLLRAVAAPAALFEDRGDVPAKTHRLARVFRGVDVSYGCQGRASDEKGAQDLESRSHVWPIEHF